MKFLTFNLLLLTFLQANENLLHSPENWSAKTDPYGSYLDSGNALIQNNTLILKIKLQAKKTFWPYGEVIVTKPLSKPKFSSIVIAYKCSTPITLKLSQSDFGAEGSKTYAHYQFTLPASDIWIKKTVFIHKFSQPNWASNQDKKAPLNLNKVEHIYLSPEIDGLTGGESLLKVKFLSIY